MKKRSFILFFVCFILFGGALYAQKIDMPSNRLEELLCRKWVASYAMLGGMRIDQKPGATAINYEFKRDKAFILTGGQPGKPLNGTWRYDSEKKVILLSVNGNKNSQVVSLKEDELMMLVDTKAATPDDPEAIRMVYKIKE